MESQGVENMLVKTEEFVTPNGAEGLKTYGSGGLPTLKEGVKESGNYTILVLNSENVIQQIVLTWREDDTYADKMVKRILNSVELKYEDED